MAEFETLKTDQHRALLARKQLNALLAELRHYDHEHTRHEHADFVRWCELNGLLEAAIQNLGPRIARRERIPCDFYEALES
ncbi:hypothetical protein JCM19379_29550 [Methyloparacoccus murrellii]